jgi:hypothetical protein
MKDTGPTVDVSWLDATFMNDVFSEAQRARLLFAGNDLQMMALTEEVGELAKALIDHDRQKAPAKDVWIEAVQVAVMAMRVATEGDSAVRYRGPEKE